MLRKFHAPAAVFAVIAAIGVVSSLAKGAAAKKQANEQASFAEAQADAAAVNAGRARRDLARDRDATLARSRATLAAGGDDTTSGTGLEVLSAQAGQFEVQDRRIQRDLFYTDAFLRAQAASTRSAGKTAMFLGVLGAAGSAVGGASSAGAFSSGGAGTSFGPQAAAQASHINRERASYI